MSVEVALRHRCLFITEREPEEHSGPASPSGGSLPQRLRSGFEGFEEDQGSLEGLNAFDITYLNTTRFEWESIQGALFCGQDYAVVIVDIPSTSIEDVLFVVQRMWQADPDIQVILYVEEVRFSLGKIVKACTYPEQMLCIRRSCDPEEIQQAITILARLRYWKRLALVQSEEENRSVPCSAEDLDLPLQHDKGSEWESLDRQLDKQTEELARSNRELEQFASCAAHDLREPLHTILVYLDLLEVKHGKELNEKAFRYVNKAKKGAARLQKLIQGLLVYSRVQESATLQADVCLKEVVGEILEDLEGMIREKRACVEVGELPKISGDPICLRQVLQNLIVNALTFHKPEDQNPKIKISAHVFSERRKATGRNGQSLCQIRVQDWGVGIPEEHLEKIFGMCKRLQRDEHYEGVGLGLALCKKVVERLGGHISVTSRVGEGSTFFVTLPMEGQCVEPRK